MGLWGRKRDLLCFSLALRRTFSAVFVRSGRLPDRTWGEVQRASSGKVERGDFPQQRRVLSLCRGTLRNLLGMNNALHGEMTMGIVHGREIVIIYPIMADPRANSPWPESNHFTSGHALRRRMSNCWAAKAKTTQEQRARQCKQVHYRNVAPVNRVPGPVLPVDSGPDGRDRVQVAEIS